MEEFFLQVSDKYEEQVIYIAEHEFFLEILIELTTMNRILNGFFKSPSFECNKKSLCRVLKGSDVCYSNEYVEKLKLFYFHRYCNRLSSVSFHGFV